MEHQTPLTQAFVVFVLTAITIAHIWVWVAVTPSIAQGFMWRLPKTSVRTSEHEFIEQQAVHVTARFYCQNL